MACPSAFALEETRLCSNLKSLKEVQILDSLSECTGEKRTDPGLAPQLVRAIETTLTSAAQVLTWMPKYQPFRTFSFSVALSRAVTTASSQISGTERIFHKERFIIKLHREGFLHELGDRDPNEVNDKWEISPEHRHTLQAILNLCNLSIHMRVKLHKIAWDIMTEWDMKPCIRILSASLPKCLSTNMSGLSTWLSAGLFLRSRNNHADYFTPDQSTEENHAEISVKQHILENNLYEADEELHELEKECLGGDVGFQVSPDWVYDNDSTAHADIAVLSGHSIEHECALEIFSVFMLELAKRIANVEGTVTATKRPTLVSMTKSHRYMSEYVHTHSGLEKIYEALMDCAPDLFPSREVAEVMVAPAFFKHGLLNPPASEGENQDTNSGDGQQATAEASASASASA
ncbi:hypothetical protein BDV95DRAFT_600375 [Massariosphaeria phaeospora]|uniref:Uncharacterized protein n=1 Tax=Massariosphaeria phaeospora TaxID=100035 RepID=A0A7C8HY68_9PLEO|nr:hypothetical protein BDV95DRAFT_600375 [Massariosphaeria phaeospora]